MRMIEGEMWYSSTEAKEAWYCTNGELRAWRKEGLPYKDQGTEKRPLYFYHPEKGKRFFQGIAFDPEGIEL